CNTGEKTALRGRFAVHHHAAHICESIARTVRSRLPDAPPNWGAEIPNPARSAPGRPAALRRGIPTRRNRRAPINPNRNDPLPTRGRDKRRCSYPDPAHAPEPQRAERLAAIEET